MATIRDNAISTAEKAAASTYRQSSLPEIRQLAWITYRAECERLDLATYIEYTLSAIEWVDTFVVTYNRKWGVLHPDYTVVYYAATYSPIKAETVPAVECPNPLELARVKLAEAQHSNTINKVGVVVVFDGKRRLAEARIVVQGFTE